MRVQDALDPCSTHSRHDNGGDLAGLKRRKAVAEPKVDPPLGAPALLHALPRSLEGLLADVAGNHPWHPLGQGQGGRELTVVGSDVGTGPTGENEVGKGCEAGTQLHAISG